MSKDTAVSPRTGAAHEFFVIHMSDAVMTLGLTAAKELVLVEQYRHGLRDVSLEIPGGLHEVAGETPQQGAARELLEETGYGGGQWRLLGELRIQPALQTNRVWVFLATGIERKGPAQPDAAEDIEVKLVPVAEIAARLADGSIQHAITIAALGLAKFAGHV
jgi:8-oxo-dGTP pyrophosphatase MutT (NUDIX family)